MEKRSKTCHKADLFNSSLTFNFFNKLNPNKSPAKVFRISWKYFQSIYYIIHFKVLHHEFILDIGSKFIK